MGDDLGVGLGGERRAARAQLVLQRHVVLDDPVDDDVDAVGAVDERVRVLLADAAVGRPAGVADADRRRSRERGRCRPGLARERRLEAVEIADRADGVNLTVAEQRHARAVVAAVFELAQPAEDYLLRRA